MVGSVLLAAGTASAVSPRTDRRVAADSLTAMPAAQVKPLRTQRHWKLAAPSTAAWQRFARAAGGSWRAAWDAATHVPNRIWGSGIAAPGANANPAAAEQHARRWLADHIALLAPGAAPSDFVLVSNHVNGDLRSIGFEQRAGGRRVLGGQISFRYKRDRLFLIGSEALPDVTVDLSSGQPRARLARAAMQARAGAHLRRELALPAAPITAVDGDDVVLPLVGDDAVYGYRIAQQLMIDGGADGRYLAYVDPASGEVLAVHQQNLYATGTVLYRGVDRYPARGRVDRPARRARVSVGGAQQTTSMNGTVSWSPDAPLTVTTAVTGDLVTLINKKNGGIVPVAELGLAPGGNAIWDASANAEDDAHVVTYIATNTVKDYVRNRIDPAMPKLDEAMIANVNIEQNCNAFFDGKSINFFHASTKCDNTGLLEDVIYHEFGHALHSAEIIKGVGAFDGAMSEGASDFLAASITNDPGMGRGFFYTDEPLRQLDPPDTEYSWPKDIGEIHATGRIFGGAFWDLRKALIAALGADAGEALVNRLFLGAMQRSVSIPTSLIETLATDDDDGDLTNGTPHECFIRDAFGRHGLRTVSGAVTAPGAIAAVVTSADVQIDLTGLNNRCAGDEILAVSLEWAPEVANAPPAGSVNMTAASTTRYTAAVPVVPDETMLYSATIQFRDGSSMTLPDNLGMPVYALYQGATMPLYCTSFDTNPFDDGWTTGTGDAAIPSPWEWGVPPGTGATDPPAAFNGTHILGQKLGGDYAAKASSFVRLPDIDVGQWSDVRVQFRRWLAVEDSYYDKARVTVNGQKAWINSTQDLGDASAIHHIDREWAFADVRVSGFAFGHVLSIGFDLASDEGLHLGGWQIDDLCVVANPKSVCGDGVRSPTEACDEGAANANVPGATCRTYCKIAGCGDSILDAGEACDEGFGGNAECDAECKIVEPEDGGGCCSTGSSPAGALALTGFAGLLLLRRRRRV